MKRFLLAILALILAGASPALADPGDAMQPDVTAAESPPVATLPTGKGMFVRTLQHAGDTPEQVLHRCRDAGLSWLCVQRIWQYSSRPSRLYNLPSHVRAGASVQEVFVHGWRELRGAGTPRHLQLQHVVDPLAEEGVALWLWGYPVPGKHDEFNDVMTHTAMAADAPGVIVDPEREWYGATDDQVAALMDPLMSWSSRTGRTVMVSSYGAPWFHGAFPWRSFAERCPIGVPQIYDGQQQMPADYPSRSVAAYQELGFETVVPASAAYGRTGEGMLELLARTPTPEDALIWWDWHNARLDPTRWAAVRTYQLPGLQA